VLPEVITPYEDGLLRPVEELRNRIALGLGKAISEDKVFKKELFQLLTRSESRSLVNIPVLMLLNEQFTAGRGKDILSFHLADSEEVSFRSEGDRIQALVQDVEPSMTIEIPVYVRAYFLTPETIDISLADFAEFPFAVYAETSQANSQGIMVGHGDATTANPDGIYGVYPSSSYENHIPIHVKRSRSLVLVENGIVRGTGLPTTEFAARLFPVAPPPCLNGLTEGFSDTPDFLEPGQSYLNVVGLSKTVGKFCPPPPPPPSSMDEICDNGVDDDEDGLVDGDDPDCQESECNNGLDDDGDGLTDEEDPDCQLSCPDNAVFYRDCEVNANRITGGRFESINWYTNIVNPLLPALESQINLTFNFFRILNIGNCESPCPLNRAFTNQTESAVSVFLHGDLLTHPFFGDALINWDDDYEYFENVLDRDLTSDRISYFLIRAQIGGQDVPPGAIRMGGVEHNGTVGYYLFPIGFSLNAYVVTSNWVNYATPFTGDLIRSDGISYTRSGNTGPDWNASYLGDIIQIDVAETDLLTVSFQEGTTTTNTESLTRSVELTGSVGRTFGLEAGPITAGANSSAGFTFGTSNMSTNQVAASTQYTLTSERVIPLSSLTLRYQDVADRSQYPNSSYQSLFVIQSHFFGIGETYSYGHNPDTRATWDRDPFSLAPTFDSEEPYQLLGEEGSPVRFINVIIQPDE
jgi:hypothetical protein